MKEIKHKVFKDNRGSYTPMPLDIMDIEWDQCSVSMNEGRYTFRGLHYQTHPPQEKYIKVIQGSIIDIGYDLVNGKTYTQEVNETNAVYLHGAGANGWLRLQSSGVENNRNAINIYSFSCFIMMVPYLSAISPPSGSASCSMSLNV